MRLRRFLSSGAAALLLLLVFTFDVIRRNVDIGGGAPGLLRDLAVIGAFALLALLLRPLLQQRRRTPVSRLGLTLIALLVILALLGITGMGVGEGFDAKDGFLLPLDYATLFAATLMSLAAGLFAVFVLQILGDLVLFRRKRHSLRNLRLFLGFTAFSALASLLHRPLDGSTAVSLGTAGAVLFAVLNSFRLSWIIYLTKREKLVTLAYSFLLFLGFLTLTILMAQQEAVLQSLLYYSTPLRQLVFLTAIFGTVYFGNAFLSTLFHLPTAEAFDRKTVEVSSLHNLSRLVTQILDFDELVGTVTSMTLQVSEAQSCWLELLREARHPGPGGEVRGVEVEIVGLRNITPEEVERIVGMARRTLRETALAERRPVVIDEARRDPRFAAAARTGLPFGSLVVVPLVSHAGPVGLLYVTKEAEYGFYRDDVDLVSAFADQATVAIENSRLIKKSIERERLVREMLLAQEMQRKLLPAALPRVLPVDLDAISLPAFEVGGDYYDIHRIDENRLGIVVGDVSGKGLSAAFYMSEVKGIFQSLSPLYPSPREFMIKANDVLVRSIDKHSFISLLYAVLDLSSGVLTLARAGHCPLLHLSGGTGRYLRPPGMGLGLSRDALFATSMEEQAVHLRPGDACVLYTDGVTEARRGADEFGYDRLLSAAEASAGAGAAGLKESILAGVRTHTGGEVHEDDLTIVVLKWLGTPGGRARAEQSVEGSR